MVRGTTLGISRVLTVTVPLSSGSAGGGGRPANRGSQSSLPLHMRRACGDMQCTCILVRPSAFINGVCATGQHAGTTWSHCTSLLGRHISSTRPRGSKLKYTAVDGASKASVAAARTPVPSTHVPCPQTVCSDCQATSGPNIFAKRAPGRAPSTCLQGPAAALCEPHASAAAMPCTPAA